MPARARRLLAVVLLAGCATGQGDLVVSVPEDRLAQAGVLDDFRVPPLRRCLAVSYPRAVVKGPMSERRA
jgi:hypothetical protein